VKPEDLKATKPYSAEILALTSTTGFIEEFYRQCNQHKTPAAAFDFLNDSYQKLFGKHKYSDYKTFKVVRERHIRKK
jgi:hypothetical protein